jgi:exonuclease SbcC
MIKSLSIKNWQSHRDTKLDFVEGVNVITGVPNSGKTAILRALFWLIENRPTGASQYMPRWFQKCVSEVTVVLSDGRDTTSITLAKSLRTNKKGDRVVEDAAYICQGPLDEEPAEYSGIGTNVPDQVEDILNFNELNIQKQLDSSFLMSKEYSGGEIARIINRITHLEEVDEWISILTTKINRLRSKEDLLADEIKDLKSQYDEYGYIEEMESLLKKASIYVGKRASVVQKIRKLDALVEDLTNKGNSIGFLKLRLRAEKYVLRAQTMAGKLEKAEYAIALVEDLKELQDKINDTGGRVSDLEVMLATTRSLADSLGKLSVQKLRGALADYQSVSWKIQKKEDELQLSEKEYKEVLKGLKVCPIFNKPCQHIDRMGR